MITDRKVRYSRRIQVYTDSGMLVSHSIIGKTKSELEEKKIEEVESIRERYDGKMELLIVGEIVCFFEKTLGQTREFEVFTNEFTNEQVPEEFQK